MCGNVLTVAICSALCGKGYIIRTSYFSLFARLFLGGPPCHATAWLPSPLISLTNFCPLLEWKKVIGIFNAPKCCLHRISKLNPPVHLTSPVLLFRGVYDPKMKDFAYLHRSMIFYSNWWLVDNSHYLGNTMFCTAYSENSPIQTMQSSWSCSEMGTR